VSNSLTRAVRGMILRPLGFGGGTGALVCGGGGGGVGCTGCAGWFELDGLQLWNVGKPQLTHMIPNTTIYYCV